VDTICIAVGLSPMSQLARIAGCEMEDGPGGLVPKVNDWGATSVPGIFAAGDVSGIEEASSAMIGGRLAGRAAARRSGYVGERDFTERYHALKISLDKLREGMFAKENRGRTDLTATDEGYPLS
jgi:pyruvate/2-oxoglutarate dehydrogenase complex dihydrolipoamide dehydrogenase (E3) component